MKLPKLAIENHQFTIIMIALLVISGIVSFLTMPRSEDPQVAPVGSSVIVVYPGAGPEDLETLVVDPLEKSINELEDIKKFNTEINDGLAVLVVEFFSGTNDDDKYSDVVQKVNKVRNKLPEDIMNLDIIKHEITSVKIVQIALVSDSASYKLLQREAESLEKELEKISGIKTVKTIAYPDQEVQISLDLEKMAQMHIPVMQVYSAIQSSNANIPAGSIDIGSKKFNVKTSGAYESLDEIKNTILHARGGKPVYLKDIAQVKFGYEDKKYYARFKDKKAVFVTITQKEGTNIFSIIDRVHERVDTFKNELPPSIELQYVFDQSHSVAYRLNVFFSNLLQGMLLVGLVVFIVFSLRASLIIAFAIPVSILIGIGFVDLSGYGLEQMTISALVIALGLLVDNAIVITENISRFLRMGYSRKEAAVQATSQVGWAVVSSTVTTILAFIPIILMQDITGDFIRSMPVTVVYTLLASLLVALTLTPYLASKFLKIDKNNGSGKVHKIINRFVETKYRKALNFALERRGLVIGIAGLLFIVSLLSARFFVGVSFFPKADKPQFVINIETPQGTSLDQTDKITEDVESILAAMDSVKLYAANIGRSNPRIYYSVIEKREMSNFAQIYVELIENDPELSSKVVAQLRRAVSKYSNARVEVKEFEQGPPVKSPVEIKIMGNNIKTLKNISRDVQKMIASTEGAININNPLSTSATDLHININRAKAGISGISLVDIDRAVRMAITGLSVSNYRDDEGDEYDIVMRLPVKDKAKLADFDKIYLTSSSGRQVPLKQIAAIEFKESSTQINHYNLDRSVSVTADVITGYSVDEVTKTIVKKLDKYNMPDGYHYYIGGELEQRQESFGGMGQAAIIAIIAIFGVLVLQFRSFSQPFIVYSAIPLAIIGSIIALLITGNTFSFTAFIGFTSLMGIVINNSIILVDYTNQLRAAGKDTISALKEAGETRFMPIILTTATTIGGLLPLTLSGGSLWEPMGWTIIGGLAFSTLLTLLVVPALYKIYTPEIQK
jgi:multidrug efflux pump subunit AcrB